MKTRIFSFVVVLTMVFSLSSFTSLAPKSAPLWEIDYTHASIGFEVNHFFTPVAGRFDEFEGTLQFNPDDLVSSKVEFTVQVSSINTQSKKRDSHLKKDDFFDAKTYPTMTFTSTKFEKTGDKTYNVTGKLRAKNVAKEVTIPFTVLGMLDHPRKKKHKLLGLKSEFKINRNDYNIGTGSFAASAVIGNEVSIKVILEASRKR